MIPICIDLETRPEPMTPEQLYTNALRSSKNQARKDDTKAAWAADPSNQTTAWTHTSLTLLGARVLAAALIIDGEPPRAVASLDESTVIRWIDDQIAPVLLEGPPLWVGHNIAAFDLPILRTAAIRNGFPRLRDAANLKKFDHHIHDNMIEACKPAASFSGVSAHALAESYGLDGKGDLAEIDFPALYVAHASGELSDADFLGLMERRCRRDVSVEWATYCKMTE